uniref:Arm DNA-binding domain-containing protein n=1 Tax=Altererythrobacter segetis TaxID=1104773 RepID=UPI00140C445F|nr:Arm DNA-binding domain-containing protein [Altererythrobacter segetis]
MKQRLTVRSLKDAQPGDRDSVLWDADLKGFGCKITPAGRKTFFYYYRTKSGQL